MGMCGCGWVCCDPRGHGEAKPRQEGLIYALSGPDLGPMAGEISPDIMFCEKTKNMNMSLRMGEHGLVWVHMHKSNQRQAKTRQK